MLKTFWITFSSTFTCMMLVFLIFYEVGYTEQIFPFTLWQCLLLCLLQSAAQVLWHIPKKLENSALSPKALLVLDAAVRLVFVLIIAFSCGSWFGFFQANLIGFWIMLPVCIPIFILVYIILYLSFRRAEKAAEEINKKIQERK